MGPFSGDGDAREWGTSDEADRELAIFRANQPRSPPLPPALPRLGPTLEHDAGNDWMDIDSGLIDYTTLPFAEYDGDVEEPAVRVSSIASSIGGSHVDEKGGQDLAGPEDLEAGPFEHGEDIDQSEYTTVTSPNIPTGEDETLDEIVEAGGSPSLPTQPRYLPPVAGDITDGTAAAAVTDPPDPLTQSQSSAPTKRKRILDSPDETTTKRSRLDDSKLIWDKEHNMKYVVHVLFSDETLTRANRARIFNKLYSDEIRDGGYTESYPYSSLSNMNHQKGRDRDGKGVPQYWRDITSPARSQEEIDKREKLLASIVKVRQMLGI